jgi:hypothetical protein
MALPWIRKVKSTKTLTIQLYNKGSLSNNASGAYSQAVSTFNSQFGSSKLCVQFNDQAPQSSQDAVNVNVYGAPFRVVSRDISTGDGNKTSFQFDGTSGFGFTEQVTIQEDSVDKICIAHIFVPTNTGLSTEMDPGLLKYLIFHELVHSCGLEDKDHSSVDIYQKPLPSGVPQNVPNPLLAQQTVDKMKKLWCDRRVSLNVDSRPHQDKATA